jgi:hypothetical protein
MDSEPRPLVVLVTNCRLWVIALKKDRRKVRKRCKFGKDRCGDLRRFALLQGTVATARETLGLAEDYFVRTLIKRKDGSEGEQ